MEHSGIQAWSNQVPRNVCASRVRSHGPSDFSQITFTSQGPYREAFSAGASWDPGISFRAVEQNSSEHTQGDGEGTLRVPLTQFFVLSFVSDNKRSQCYFTGVKRSPFTCLHLIWSWLTGVTWCQFGNDVTIEVVEFSAFRVCLSIDNECLRFKSQRRISTA